MCRTNLVGNGSGAMMRKDAVIAAGLYDPSLRARGAQGCEDYKLYLALAAAGDVVVVPDFLTGYRTLPKNMSSDVVQMCRSHLLVVEEFRAQHPDLGRYLDEGRRLFGRWLVMRALRQMRPGKIHNCSRRSPARIAAPPWRWRPRCRRFWSGASHPARDACSLSLGVAQENHRPFPSARWTHERAHRFRGRRVGALYAR